MDKIRKQIDEIDTKLMSLLNERYALTKRIGKFKMDNNIGVTNSNREKDILNKADQYLYAEEIKLLYRQLFASNKKYQDFHYGLIGKKLPYTMSPIIFDLLGIKNYHVIETNDFKKTMDKIVYKGVTVTIPYKTEAYEYCEELDESAGLTHTVNTIIGKKGYNTDYLGYLNIFKKLNIDFTNKKIIIIGNGATSRTVAAAVGGNPTYLVRTIRGKHEYLISEYKQFLDSDYIFNTTPYGTSPNYQDLPLFPLGEFTKLKMVFDVIYNPLKSPLLIEAKKHGIKAMNGIELLIEQANVSYNLFTGETGNRADNIIKEFKKKVSNIVFIGMSYSGKSTIGAEVAKALNKNFIDLDVELAKVGRDLNTLIKDQPVTVFRKYETEMAIKFSNHFNQTIATGGGTVLSEAAMNALARNAIIVFLDTPIELLKSRIDGSRPLIKTEGDLEQIYRDRINLYLRYADIRISNKMTILEIVEKINEVISN